MKNRPLYRSEECSVKCEWSWCYAGMGLVGTGHCFAGGAWWMFCCPAFQDEEEWLNRKMGQAKGEVK